jgi:hypothetical protein
MDDKVSDRNELDQERRERRKPLVELLLTVLVLVILVGAVILEIVERVDPCWDCPIPENGWVVLDPGQPDEYEVKIRVKEFNRRVEEFASQLPAVEPVQFTLGFYSQDIYDLSPAYWRTEGWTEEEFEVYNKYARIFNALTLVPSVKVAFKDGRFQLDLHELAPTCLCYPTFAFLVSEEGKVIPVYPDKYGAHFRMYNQAGLPGFESLEEVTFGHYVFYVVTMPNAEGLDISNASSVVAYELALVPGDDPVNEWFNHPKDGHAWAFSADPNFMDRLNPYQVGQIVYVTPELAEHIEGVHKTDKMIAEDDPEHDVTPLREVWEEAEVIEAGTTVIRVRFSDGEEDNYGWTWFAASPGE